MNYFKPILKKKRNRKALKTLPKVLGMRKRKKHGSNLEYLIRIARCADTLDEDKWLNLEEREQRLINDIMIAINKTKRISPSRAVQRAIAKASKVKLSSKDKKILQFLIHKYGWARIYDWGSRASI